MSRRFGAAGVAIAMAFTLNGCAIPFYVSAPQITPDLVSDRALGSSPNPNTSAFCVNDLKSSHLVAFGYAVKIPATVMAQALVGGLASGGLLARPGRCRYAIAAQVIALRDQFVNLPFAPLPITSVVTYTMTDQSTSRTITSRTITEHFREPYVVTLPLDVGSEETVHRAIRGAIQANLKRYIESLIDMPASPPVS
jgi:hypothetical protein